MGGELTLLPLSEAGRARFGVVTFDEDSRPGRPVLLTLVASVDGTSVTLADGSRQSRSVPGGRGQRLYFDDAGVNALFVARRRATGTAVLDRDTSVLLVVQVPVTRDDPTTESALSADPRPPDATAGGSAPTRAGAPAGDGWDEVGRRYETMRGLSVRRDVRAPIRVMVQLVRLSADGVVTADDMDAVQRALAAVVEDAPAAVSSLLADE